MATSWDTIPDLDTIRDSARRIAAHIHHTPVMTCQSLDVILNARVFFKCENLQKAGAFKSRGASNAVFSLSDEVARRGVTTHSSGNHAGALARAAQRRGIAATIVMPENAPAVKKAAVAGYGARIVFCRPTQADREATVEQVIAETGAELIHPYNDYRIIAGQATAALELLADVPDLDAILAPVGGGGLMSGTALATRYLAPRVRVIGTEPAGADDAYRSFVSGTLHPQTDPRTMADGLRTSLSERTFEIIRRHVDEIVTVSEAGIIQAMRHVFERMKLVIEPSSAVPVAALLEGCPDLAGRRVGVIISGGNVDLDHLPWLATTPPAGGRT